ncbi:MAG: flavodoxin domain-containing protein [Candidatus Limnocylindria bacterium]
MKVLVISASKHGATTEIADAITETLLASGIDADHRAPAEVGDLTEYDAVVIGSAIYTGRWLEPARRLIERQHAALEGLPVWLFSSGPVGDPLAPTEEPQDGVRLCRELKARQHVVFAGKLNASDLSWVERTITGMLKSPYGDFRNWDAIRAWAQEIATALMPGGETA